MSRTDAHRPSWTLTAADVAHLPVHRRRFAAKMDALLLEVDEAGVVDRSTGLARQCRYCCYSDCGVCGARTPHWYGHELMVVRGRQDVRRALRAALRSVNGGADLDCDCCQPGCVDCAEDFTPAPPRQVKPGVLAHWYW